MIPGTTPTHIFRIPLLAADVAKLRITYAQGGKIVLQKELKDCTVTDGAVAVRLKQEDTLKLASNVKVRIQMKVRTTGTDVLVSNYVDVPSEIVLDREVI